MGDADGRCLCPCGRLAASNTSGVVTHESSSRHLSSNTRQAGRYQSRETRRATVLGIRTHPSNTSGNFNPRHVIHSPNKHKAETGAMNQTRQCRATVHTPQSLAIRSVSQRISVSSSQKTPLRNGDASSVNSVNFKGSNSLTRVPTGGRTTGPTDKIRRTEGYGSHPEL
jgi:hypothetical protein